MTVRRQERKVVTVLFCDLVGFTRRAEEMDPEDVAALLGPYHARLKEELERYGGTVEKFIGDAVMALFGAPTAHEDDPERAGSRESVADLLEEARDALLAVGDREGAAEAQTLAAYALRKGGTPLDALDRAQGAATLLEDAAPSRAKTYVLANLARFVAVIAFRHEDAIELGRVALAMADGLGLVELKAHALNTIGLARVLNGDVAGIDELEESLRLVLEHGSPFEIGRVYNNLAVGYSMVGRVTDGDATAAAGLELADRFGLPTGPERELVAVFAYHRGRWEEAERRVDELLAAESTPSMEPALRSLLANLRLARDDVAGAISECERALALVRGMQQDVEAKQGIRVLLCQRAAIAVAEGRGAVAHELVDAVLATPVHPDPDHVIELALLLVDLGRPGDSVIEKASSRPDDPWLQVAEAIVQGRLEHAADRLAVMGTPHYEAAVRSRLAARLLAEGRRGNADVQLLKALAFYRSVGATRYVREGEALLAAAG